MPLSGPLSTICHGRRSLSYIAAYSDRRRLAVDHQVDRADAVVDEEHLLPRLPAIHGSEDAPLGVLREQMSHGRDVDDVRILRMDDDARDVMRVGETHELPGRAGIRGLEDAFAGIRGPRVRLVARAHPDDAGVRRGDRHRADGRGADAVGDVGPCGSRVRRLPEPAAPRRRVDRVEVIVERRVRDGDLSDPCRRPEGADVPESQGVDDGVERGRLLRAGHHGRRGAGQRHREWRRVEL